MPVFYGLTPATAGNLTTSGTPNTATETAFVKPGATRTLYLNRFDVCGKGAGLTAISGIAFRLKKWTTASTAGTGMTPQPRSTQGAAATATAASRPTAGSGGGTPVLVFSCGAAGPGGWVAANADCMHDMPAASAGSFALDDASGTASMNFEFSAEMAE